MLDLHQTQSPAAADRLRVVVALAPDDAMNEFGGNVVGRGVLVDEVVERELDPPPPQGPIEGMQPG